MCAPLARVIEIQVVLPSSLYRLFWRWHFFAALLVIPFVIWQGLTGSLYLWSGQWMDSDPSGTALREPGRNCAADQPTVERRLGGTSHGFHIRDPDIRRPTTINHRSDSRCKRLGEPDVHRPHRRNAGRARLRDLATRDHAQSARWLAARRHRQFATGTRRLLGDCDDRNRPVFVVAAQRVVASRPMQCGSSAISHLVTKTRTRASFTRLGWPQRKSSPSIWPLARHSSSTSKKRSGPAPYMSEKKPLLFPDRTFAVVVTRRAFLIEALADPREAADFVHIRAFAFFGCFQHSATARARLGDHVRDMPRLFAQRLRHADRDRGLREAEEEAVRETVRRQPVQCAQTTRTNAPTMFCHRDRRCRSRHGACKTCQPRTPSRRSGNRFRIPYRSQRRRVRSAAPRLYHPCRPARRSAGCRSAGIRRGSMAVCRTGDTTASAPPRFLDL